MARYNERNTRQSRFTEDEEPRSTRRQPTGRTPARGGRGGRQQKQEKQEYFPIFSLFGNEQRDGRLAIDIKAYDGKGGSIEDHLTIEEFLFFCEKLYYGEPLTAEDEWGVKLTGSLWEMDSPTQTATHSGNIRFSEERLEQIKDEYQLSLGERKPAAKTKSAAKPTATRKPKYEVPVEPEYEDDDDEEYEEAPAPAKKKRQPVKPAVELDMETEVVVADDYADETEPPY